MKACPHCGKKGKLLGHEAISLGGTAVQILDYELECPEHGKYEGNFTPESCPDRERVPSPLAPPPEPLPDPEPEKWPEIQES